MKNFLKSDILIIFFLGISSGLPLALVLSTLKVFLVDLNIDIKTIGLFSLIALPYSLKFLWAPLVDWVKLPFFNQTFGPKKIMDFAQTIFINCLNCSAWFV